MINSSAPQNFVFLCVSARSLIERKIIDILHFTPSSFFSEWIRRGIDYLFSFAVVRAQK